MIFKSSHEIQQQRFLLCFHSINPWQLFHLPLHCFLRVLVSAMSEKLHLPKSAVKRIMKLNDDVKVISGVSTAKTGALYDGSEC